MKDWYVEARELRAAGWKLLDIGRKFGVTAERAGQVCRGVCCPINHAANRAKPRVEAHGEFIREHYHKIPASTIAKRLGITRNAVIGAARRMGLCRSAA